MINTMKRIFHSEKYDWRKCIVAAHEWDGDTGIPEQLERYALSKAFGGEE